MPNKRLVEAARVLRTNSTDAERALWRELRAHRFAAFKFRRQAPIGQFVADFVSFSAKLIIELDGGHHGQPEQAAHDAERTAWLESQGFRVLRFWNNEVLTNLEGVLEVLQRAVEPETPSP